MSIQGALKTPLQMGPTSRKNTLLERLLELRSMLTNMQFSM